MAEFEFSFIYGKHNKTPQETFGLNCFYARFFAPIYQGEKLNISMGIGGFTPGLYFGNTIVKQMTTGAGVRPTFGINIDYNVTPEQRSTGNYFIENIAILI